MENLVHLSVGRAGFVEKLSVNSGIESLNPPLHNNQFIEMFRCHIFVGTWHCRTLT
ncbi:MAG: hypothetical protein ACOC07_18140 [Coleofasciculus sp.]